MSDPLSVAVAREVAKEAGMSATACAVAYAFGLIHNGTWPPTDADKWKFGAWAVAIGIPFVFVSRVTYVLNSRWKTRRDAKAAQEEPLAKLRLEHSKITQKCGQLEGLLRSAESWFTSALHRDGITAQIQDDLQKGRDCCRERNQVTQLPPQG